MPERPGTMPRRCAKQNDAYGALNHRFWTFMRLVLFDATERIRGINYGNCENQKMTKNQ